MLVLELMGRHSNLLLLDDQRQVITLGRQVRDHQSRVRPIGTGDGYVPPPPLQGLPPDPQESNERWKQRLLLLPIPLRKALQQSYQGISPPLIRQMTGSLADSCVQDLSPDQWEQVHRSWQLWLQALEQESFRLQLQDDGRYQVWGTDEDKGEPGLALALGRWYREQLDQRALSRKSDEVRQRLERWRGKEELALTDQMQRRAATAGSDDLQQQADALLCLPSPTREQVDQAQKLYRRARKLRRSVAVLEERLNHHQRRLDLINGSEAFIEDLQIAHWQPVAPRLTALQDLRSELEELLNPGGRQQERRQQRQSTPQPLELVSPGGLVLQVGRNHRQNDWISLRQARSGDLWFHAQECPGSHVVLKASSGVPEDDDLTLAADLAAYFSRARGNSRVAVVMVPTMQLQRIAGAGPGTVRHRGGEIRWGEPQRAEQHLHDSAASSLASTGV